MDLLTLEIPATEDTPCIKYSSELNEFVMSGRSLPEDVTTFYKPVFTWLDEFEKGSASKATFKFQLEYFNTASSKIILDILMRLEELMKPGQDNIAIEWYYQESDEDMQEAGEEYRELVEVPFNVIAY